MKEEKEKIDLKQESKNIVDENYTSLVDEFRRQKIVYRSKTFKADTIDIVWDALGQTIAKTFKIKRKLKENIEFGIKVKGVFTKYILESYNQEKYEIAIFWLNAKDKYWLHYKIIPTVFNNKFKIKFKEIVHREQTFFGLADTAGLFLLKFSFRKNVKMFADSINSIISENKSINNIELEIKNSENRTEINTD